MNKNKFTEFFKGKGYYVLLFVGVMAIAAVAIIGSQLSSNNKTEDQEYADLNDTGDNNTADNGEDTQLTENDPISNGFANNGSISSDETANDEGQPVAGDQVEYEGYEADNSAGDENAQATDQTEQAQTDKSDETAKADDKSDTAESTDSSVEANSNALDNLSFKADDGLSWPVDGDVIMNYSMEHTVYFATLMQYKVNPAIIIGADVGAEVKAAADGVVTDIVKNNEETGYTMTMAIGNGFSVVYGQLDKDTVSLKVGDSVKEGAVIGKVAAPTKYYSVEGSNLYFQVFENDDTVNPMMYLK